MFELKQIMRQRESKDLAELLNRLREGNHTKQDIQKLEQKIISITNHEYPKDAPHVFIQNAKVNDFNARAHNALPGIKYSTKAHDSVIGDDSEQLRDKILSQIPNDPRKTKHLHSVLQLAVGERTEISLNTRTDHGMTNGAGNVIKLIQVHPTGTPSGVIWVQFDHPDVSQKTRQDNRQLYINGIQPTWTPIIIQPITTQFAVGRTRSVQVIRKQFPMRPAAAKTIHRSPGDTESRIVVNLETRRAIPHVHYVGLSRVTTINGLFITDLCEDKIAVSNDVQTEMQRLSTEGQHFFFIYLFTIQTLTLLILLTMPYHSYFTNNTLTLLMLLTIPYHSYITNNTNYTSNTYTYNTNTKSTEGQLPLSIKPIYEAPNNSIKICFLNARSLHKHVDDIRHDLN